MSEMVDHGGILLNQPQILDLSLENRGAFLGASIYVPNEMIAASLWKEMIEKTQAADEEFGVIISSRRKEILTSRIFKGLGESKDYNGRVKSPASFTPPFLPHGLKSLSPFVKDLVLVHTHPIPTEISHLPTTVMSGADINVYVTGPYNALVMIDKGGVHMLTGRNPYRPTVEINESKIISEALEVTKNSTNKSAEFRAEIAKRLAPFGIKYYFSPDITYYADRPVLLNDSVR